MYDRFYEANELLAHVPADSETSAINSGWVSMATFREIVALVSVGDIAASGTFDMKFQQATDSSGTGAKDVTGASATQLTQAGSGSDKAVCLSVLAEDLDVDNDFTHVRLVSTPATAATEFGAFVLGCQPRHRPVATTNWQEIVTV